LYKGCIRINAHNTREAYVTAEGLSKDVYVEGFTTRNRAMDGDIVVVQLYEKSKWKVLKNIDDERVDELLDIAGPPASLASNLPHDEVQKLNTDAVTLESAKELAEDESDEDEDDEDEDDDEIIKRISDNEEDENRVEDPFEDERSAKPPVEEDESDSEEEQVESESDDFQKPESKEEALALKKTTVDPQVPMTPLVHQMEKLRIAPASSPAAPSEKQAGELQPAGKVVAIIEAKHSTEQVGHLKPMEGNDIRPDDRFACFIPIDIRISKILVPIGEIPEFYKNWRFYETKLVRVEIRGWRATSYLPLGKFKGVLGEAGEIGPETEALLVQYKVDGRDFSPDVYKCVQQYGVWKIPESEFKIRRDLREYRIFTIDPATAKDLDDALHCIPLPDGNFEVGVHIADVSYFVAPGTALDEEAKKRATTVYMVQKAIPMLPHILCENLCSLNPGVDRFAFSVIWKMTPKGEILEEWFGRTIIRSCSKMPYDVAQQIIEGKITKSWDDTGVDKQFANLGPVGKHSVQDIVTAVLNMQNIAKVLRKQRFEVSSI
jgi:DIS3-like exonuclease 2